LFPNTVLERSQWIQRDRRAAGSVCCAEFFYGLLRDLGWVVNASGVDLDILAGYDIANGVVSINR
jgi:hypothetical protein